MADIQHKRGTRTDLNTLAAASGLLVGQVYVITDEDRLAVATSTSAYQATAKEGEGGGGLTLLSQEIITTAVAAVDFTLPAAYSRFRIKIENLSADSGTSFFLAQVSTNGGTSFLNTDYKFFYTKNGGGGAFYTSQSIFLGETTGELTQKNMITTELASNASVLQGTSLRSSFDGSNAQITTTGFYRAMAAKSDAIRFSFSSANFDTGTLSLYGYKETP